MEEYFKSIFALNSHNFPNINSKTYYQVLSQPLLQRSADYNDVKSACIIQSGLES